MSYIVCWNHDCRQIYSSSEFKPTDRDVKCPKCGDTLISPNGKVQLTGRPWVIKTIDPSKLKEEDEDEDEVNTIHAKN